MQKEIPRDGKIYQRKSRQIAARDQSSLFWIRKNTSRHWKINQRGISSNTEKTITYTFSIFSKNIILYKLKKLRGVAERDRIWIEN